MAQKNYPILFRSNQYFLFFNAGHMDFLERNYGKNIGIRLRMKDMVRVSPLEEEREDRPESLQNYYDERY